MTKKHEHADVKHKAHRDDAVRSHEETELEDLTMAPIVMPHATAKEIHDEFNLGIEACAHYCESNGRPSVAAELRKLKQA